jgi:LacI family transcriptional regulator, galactose operon repressor
VPDDLSVVGFDGIEPTEWTQPTLTTIEQSIDVIAKTAISALNTQIDDPDQALANYVFRPRLKLGGTTGPPSAPPESRADPALRLGAR